MKRLARTKKAKDWPAIQSLIEQGVPYKQVSAKHGVTETNIRKRASIEKWSTPRAVEKRIQELKSKQFAESENGHKNVVESNQSNMDLIAQTWLDRQEEHRLKAYKIARRGLQRAEDTEIPVLDWRDVETIDKMGRRAVGLDGSDNVQVNIGLQLVNQRISQEDLPLDAV